jgi:hypothetical protein
MKIEVRAIREQAKKIAGILPSSYDNNVLDARIHERLDRIENHWPVENGQQMFIGDTRERVEARTLSASKDDALHE